MGGKQVRVRADTFGYVQRCFPDQSHVDQKEARGVGRYAAKLATSGDVDGSVAIIRTSPIGVSQPYAARYERLELSDVAAKTKHMPAEFSGGHTNVLQKFLYYGRPRVGDLPVYERV